MRVHLGQFAVIAHGDLLHPPGRNLAGKVAQALSELEVRGDLSILAHRNAGEVHRIPHDAFAEIIPNLDRDVVTNLFLRFHCRSPDVRRRNHVRQTYEVRIGIGLGPENVEAGARQLSGLEGLDQSSFVDELAPGCIDEVGTGFHLCDGAGIHDVPR